MEKRNYKVLIVEDNEDHAMIFGAFLANSSGIEIDVIHVTNLQDALQKVTESPLDIILLDLMLPDSRGLTTFTRLQEKAPHLPFVVITALNDESYGVEAVQAGAQDFLIKGKTNGEMLIRSIRYAILRHKEGQRLRKLAMIDDLSQVFNRRGFFSFFKQYTKLAQREEQQLLLLMLDIDKLKNINDTFGHLEGDRAIIDTAKILNDTFRSSDLIARIGGDEFAVLAIQASGENEAQIRARLKEKTDEYNQANPNFTLSFSLGIIQVDPDKKTPLKELLDLADKALYEEK